MADIIWSNVENLATKSISALIENSEYNFNKQIYDIADEIYRNKDVSLVLLAGPSASGKTTSANLLADRLEYKGIKVYRLSTDDYFINRKDVPILPSGVRDYDNIDHIFLNRMQADVKKILDSTSFTPLTFDFIDGKSQEGKHIDINPQDIVILEGIHALNPLVTALCEDKLHKVKKISIAPRRTFVMKDCLLLPNELRLLRRLIRDYYTRGYNFEQTLRQWVEVRRAEEKYIKPHVSSADYMLDSVYDYELLVYKQCIYNAIKGSTLYELKNIRKALDEVNGMHIEAIPTTSMLNEFVHYGDLTQEKK